MLCHFLDSDAMCLFNLIWPFSRGGLVVEQWSDNRLHSATVGSNLHQVWCINRSVEETLCHNSNCRMPSLRVYNTLKIILGYVRDLKEGKIIKIMLHSNVKHFILSLSLYSNLFLLLAKWHHIPASWLNKRTQKPSLILLTLARHNIIFVLLLPFNVGSRKSLLENEGKISFLILQNNFFLGSSSHTLCFDFCTWKWNGQITSLFWTKTD